MTTTIDVNSDVEKIQSRIGKSNAEVLRTSEERRRYLQKVGKWSSGKTVNVNFVRNQASCAPSMRKSVDYEIQIPVEPESQDVTDLSPRVWDLLFQETELMHELGHAMYTDFERYEEIMANEVGMRKVGKMFKNFWNALEDGAIEHQLSQEFGIRNDLDAKNANLLMSFSELKKQAQSLKQNANGTVTMGIGGAAGGIELTMFSAVQTAAMDMAKWDSGRLEAALDPSEDFIEFINEDVRSEFIDVVLPLVGNAVEDVLTEPSGTRRVEKTWDWFEAMVEYFEFPQEDPDSAPEPNDDASNSSSTMSPDENADNLDGDSNQIEVEARIAAQGDEEDTDDEETASGSGGENTEEEDTDDEETASGSGGEDTDGEDESDEDGDDPDNRASIDFDEDELSQKYQSEVQGKDEEDQSDEEVGKLIEALKAAGASGAEKVVWSSDEDGVYNSSTKSDRYAKARDIGQSLKAQWQARLQAEKESSISTGERAGRIDTRAMMKASRGNARVFKRETQEEDKDYRAAIIIDRSGSMSKNAIKNCEIASGALSYGLEAVGGESMVVGMRSNTAHIEKGFNHSIEERKDDMFGGVKGGGTPSDQLLRLTRERLKQTGENSIPFIVFITDGMPDSPSEYEEELANTNMPVLGVFTDNEGVSEDSISNLYHNQIVEEDSSEVPSRISKLIQGVMF